MKKRERHETLIPVSETRWLAYAVAGAASALAGNHAAEGAIHYSGLLLTRLKPTESVEVNFPLDKPGDSLRFKHIASDDFPSSFAGFKVALKNGRSGSFDGPSSSIDFAIVNRSQKGDAVSRGRFYRGLASRSGFGTLAYNFGEGYFRNKGIGYIGFRFNSGKGLQYGWARVRMQGEFKANAFEVVDYAYGDPGEKIVCGQKSSGENALPRAWISRPACRRRDGIACLARPAQTRRLTTPSDAAIR